LDYHLFRSLSNRLSGVPFNNDVELQNWLDVFTAKPADFFKRGIENLPERWEAVVNNGEEYIIDWLFDYLCENKLFGSVKNRTKVCTNPILDTSKSTVSEESKQELKDIIPFGINALFASSHAPLGSVFLYNACTTLKK
jgi:hypothetical protein